MTEEKSISLVNLGNLSKPADTLINKVSNAIGGIFEPWQVKRVAKAQAEAELIKAKSDIKITDLHRRAMHRFVEEEASRQENMEQITRKAIPKLAENSNPNSMENDWLANFFDKSRIVSDEEMQLLWASVLAGEANAPGSYSKRTVNFLADLDKRDAEQFQSLFSFGWYVGGFTPIVFDTSEKIYNDHGVNFSTLSHLESIGLIQFDNLAGFRKIHVPKKFPVSYCGKEFILTFEKDSDNEINTGKATLTQIGHELASVSTAPGIVEFENFILEKWKAYNPKNIETEQNIPADPQTAQVR
jgi:hypothetical protein